MENNLNREPDFDETHKDQRQGNPQKDREKQQEKAKEETNEKNKNFDQVQRRKQASPRSYNESLESENIENQNTEAHREQSDRAVGTEPIKNEKKGEKIGYDISERQQTFDEDDEQKNKKGRTEGNP